MRLDHIFTFTLVKLLFNPSGVLHKKDLHHTLLKLFIIASGHSGEVIPVPIPNTEVKLSYVDDTGFVPGK